MRPIIGEWESSLFWNCWKFSPVSPITENHNISKLLQRRTLDPTVKPACWLNCTSGLVLWALKNIFTSPKANLLAWQFSQHVDFLLYKWFRPVSTTSYNLYLSNRLQSANPWPNSLTCLLTLLDNWFSPVSPLTKKLYLSEGEPLGLTVQPARGLGSAESELSGWQEIVFTLAVRLTAIVAASAALATNRVAGSL